MAWYYRGIWGRTVRWQEMGARELHGHPRWPVRRRDPAGTPSYRQGPSRGA